MRRTARRASHRLAPTPSDTQATSSSALRHSDAKTGASASLRACSAISCQPGTDSGTELETVRRPPPSMSDTSAREGVPPALIAAATCRESDRSLRASTRFRSGRAINRPWLSTMYWNPVAPMR